MTRHYVNESYNRRSDVLLYRIRLRDRKVRTWHATSGSLVGIWQGRDGKTNAVGHDQNGKLIVYRAIPPRDNWTTAQG